MPLPIANKVIEDSMEMGGVKSIKLHLQGEGTLHPQLGQIARLACSVCNDVLLTTNGTKLDAKKAQELIDAGLHFVRVSIYEETKPSVQSNILANIRTLREMRDAQGKSSPYIVKANGDVAPCCQAWDQSLNVGNVMEDSLLNIWRGERLASLHRFHLEGRRKEIPTCSTCDALWTNKDSIDALSAEEYEKRRDRSWGRM